VASLRRCSGSTLVAFAFAIHSPVVTDAGSLGMRRMRAAANSSDPHTGR